MVEMAQIFGVQDMPCIMWCSFWFWRRWWEFQIDNRIQSRKVLYQFWTLKIRTISTVLVLMLVGIPEWRVGHATYHRRFRAHSAGTRGCWGCCPPGPRTRPSHWSKSDATHCRQCPLVAEIVKETNVSNQRIKTDFFDSLIQPLVTMAISAWWCNPMILSSCISV